MTAIANLPDIRPSLLLDFANSRRVDPRIQCTRGSSATCWGPDGRLRTVPANVPRIDFDPVTGKCRGLLVEDARTNLVKNNSTAGAVVGVIGSGGALPTGWSAPAAGGVTAEVLAIGVEDGIPYVDIQFYGTATTAYQALVFGNVSGYTSSADFTGSAYARLLSGAIPASGDVQFKIRANRSSAGVADVNGVFNNASFTAAKLKANRLAVTGQTPSDATGSGQLLMVFNYTTGTTINMAIRIGLPQLEAGNSATTPILTTGSAVTRAGEQLLLALPEYSDISVLVEFTHGTRLANTRAAGLYSSVSAGYNASIIAANASNTSSAGAIFSSSMINAAAPIAAVSGRTDKVAFSRTEAGAVLLASRGQARGSGQQTVASSKMDMLCLGNSSPSGTLALCGHIRRVAIYPAALSQAYLNRLTEV